MPNDTTPDLASLLCSRLCHDLLSPVGAMANGLELLADEKNPEMRQRCMELLENSAKISTDKLKFFRLAFGSASGFDHMVPLEEPKALIAALIANNGRITLEWSAGTPALPKTAIKVLLNLALIGIESLARGGTLAIGVEASEGGGEIAIRAAGPKITFDPVIGMALDGSLPVSDLSSRTAPAAMVHQLVTDNGGGLQVALSPEALVLGCVMG